MGAESNGAQAKVIDLYCFGRFIGCVSRLERKSPGNVGQCINKDGLAPVFEEIRTAYGMIIRTPNCFIEASAGFRAMFERLIFQYISSCKAVP